jgi:hypothetical protein
MSYDKYALILALEHRQRQIDEAADHHRSRLARVHTPSRQPLRPIGRLFVRLGRALGAEPDTTLDQTLLQPARSR